METPEDIATRVNDSYEAMLSWKRRWVADALALGLGGSVAAIVAPESNRVTHVYFQDDGHAPPFSLIKMADGSIWCIGDGRLIRSAPVGEVAWISVDGAR